MLNLNKVNQAVVTLIDGELAESNLTKAFKSLASCYSRVGTLQDDTAFEMCLAYSVLNVGVDKSEMTLAKYARGEGVAIHWWAFSGTSQQGKLIKASRDQYVQFMEAVTVEVEGVEVRRFETNNIDKIWSRIKELSGKPVNSAKKSEDKSPDAVTFKELATILRRIQKAEDTKEYAPKCIKAHSAFEDAYVLMGGILSDVYKSED